LISALAAFTGALLLFWLQPLVGRLLLPRFGGGPAVWALTLVFFQSILLVGYAWAHLIVLRLSPRAGRVLHLTLAAAAAIALPVHAPEVNASSPAAAVLLALFLGVGAPAMALAATAPLVQAWASQSGSRAPWGLYAWSNAGSLGALAAYPFVLEPALGIRHQGVVWSVGYGVLVVLLALAARRPAVTLEAHEAPAAPTPLGDRLLWFSLTACSSALLVATSDQITEDLAASPFLWVLPLGLFLLSYIAAFGRPGWTMRPIWLPALAVGMVSQWWVQASGFRSSIPVQLVVHGGTLLAACMVLHGELVRLRPPAARLTGFYLTTALGGAFGGVLVSLVAPVALSLRLELPIALVVAGLLAIVCVRRSRRSVVLRGEPPWIWALPVMLVLGLGGLYAREILQDQRDVLAMERSFFGVLRVRSLGADDVRGPSRRLLHGRIMHGQEFTDERLGQPTAYFGPRSGIALLFRQGEHAPPRQVAVLGLGIGTLAAFARCGDTVDFYEIDPAVEVMARAWFTFLKPSCATINIHIADGRLGLAMSENINDFIVMDAFSGDSVPSHLLTREAVAQALEHLGPLGTLAFNVSNRHLDLRPVLRAHARHFGLALAEITSPGDRTVGLSKARWLLLTRDPTLVPWIEALGELDAVPPDAPTLEWTDDHAPLLPLLRSLN